MELDMYFQYFERFAVVSFICCVGFYFYIFV